MQNRRTFIKNTGLMALGSLMIPSYTLLAGQFNDIGLQLYTIRDAIEEDLEGTLQQVADIGYKNLESSMGNNGHYYGKKPIEFKKLLNQYGLTLRSSHVLTGIKQPGSTEIKYATLSNGLEELVENAAETGQSYLVCAYLFPDERQTLDDYKRHAELFNKAGEACKGAGLQFAYHNHDFEFKEIDGQLPFDFLLSQTDPELVKIELDLYWITKAGFDPVNYFDMHTGRFPLWHIKDMDDSEHHSFTEVGNGVIDFNRIFKKSGKAGMEYFFVEQDASVNPLKSIAVSHDYLKNELLNK